MSEIRKRPRRRWIVGLPDMMEGQCFVISNPDLEYDEAFGYRHESVQRGDLVQGCGPDFDKAKEADVARVHFQEWKKS